MLGMRKSALLLLILVITGLNIGVISAGNVIKPSVPEFSLKLVHYSSDDPAVYGIDPYTGENVTITPAKHQESSEIHIIIKNQPFTPYNDSSGNLIGLYYGVRSKGHFSNDWSKGIISVDKDNSSFTVTSQSVNYMPADAQVDFQVKAMVGYFEDTGLPSYVGNGPVFVGENSDWSVTQTITLSDGGVVTVQPTPSPTLANPTDSPTENPTATPLQSDTQSAVLFGLDWDQVAVVVLGVVVVLLVVVIVFQHQRRVK
jgi:hypothetical protein